MSVADKLQQMYDDLTDCYYFVNEKGGTIPQDQNLDNLSAAIDSIINSVRVVTLTKTLSANANDITFTHTEGEAPKAVILRSTNETHINGEIYYATCVGQGGYGECKNLATGNVSQGFYKVGQTGLYNRVTMGTTIVSFNRIIANSMFPANVPYELTMYFWDEV